MAPGHPIARPPWKVTGRTAGQIGSISGRIYSLNLAADPAGPLTARSAREAAIAMTPCMFGALTGAATNYGDRGVVSNPGAWPRDGHPVSPPYRAVIIKDPYGGTFLADSVRTAIGARLLAAKVWCGVFDLQYDPCQSGVPASGVVDCSLVIPGDGFPSTIDAPVVEPDRWIGREVLYVHTCLASQGVPYGTLVLAAGQGSGEWPRSFYTFPAYKAACMTAIANTFASGMFHRSRLALIAGFPAAAAIANPGAMNAFQRNGSLANLADAATAAGGTLIDQPDVTLAQLTSLIVTAITDFYGDV